MKYYGVLVLLCALPWVLGTAFAAPREHAIYGVSRCGIAMMSDKGISAVMPVIPNISGDDGFWFIGSAKDETIKLSIGLAAARCEI